MIKETKTYSIYSIRNKANGKRYIGYSYQPLKRMEYHRKSKYIIGKAIRKYGWENFTKLILQNSLTLKQAQKRERFWIKKYNCISPNGYNITHGGNARGTYKSSKITKERLSKSKKKQWKNPKYRKQMDLNFLKQQAKIHNITLKEWKEANKLETKICACGCNKKFKTRRRYTKKFIHGHNGQGTKHPHSIKSKKLISKNSAMKGKTKEQHPKWIPREIRICACGCKQTFECRIDNKQKFITGHNTFLNNPMKNPKTAKKSAKTRRKNGNYIISIERKIKELTTVAKRHNSSLKRYLINRIKNLEKLTSKRAQKYLISLRKILRHIS